MKIRYLFALTFLAFASAPAVADDVVTFVWEDGCNHTMTTNHFMLAPGEEATVEIDLSGCDQAGVDFDDLLVFAYRTSKNRSRQLTAKDRVELSMYGTDALGVASTSTATSKSGSLLVEIDTLQAVGCVMTIKNTGRKEMKLRLRSQLIAAYEP